MLVPSPVLVRLAAAVILPAAALGGLVPAAAGLAAAVVVVFLLFAAFDALHSLDVLDDLTVELPPVVRFTKGQAGKISLRLGATKPRTRSLQLALATPPSLPVEPEVFLLTLGAEAGGHALDWSVTARERGIHRLPAVHAETRSPFGLWSVRRAFPQVSEVRVYPDLRTDRRAIAAAFLTRNGVGTHVHRQVGKGREFEKLRDYVHGDGVEDIHWKATAKRGRPVTKLFQIERTQELYVVLDASRLTTRPTGPGGEAAFERSLRAALLLAAAAERQGDRFGVVAFDSQVRRFVRAGSGRGHFAACRDALFALQAQPVTPDFEELATELRLRLRRRVLLVFLTALDDPLLAESFVGGMKLLSRQHLVVAVQPRPAGTHPLFSGPDATSLDDVYANLGGHLRWQRLRLLEQVLRRHNVRFTLADHEALAATALRQYLDVKRRQLL